MTQDNMAVSETKYETWLYKTEDPQLLYPHVQMLLKELGAGNVSVVLKDDGGGHNGLLVTLPVNRMLNLRRTIEELAEAKMKGAYIVLYGKTLPYPTGSSADIKTALTHLGLVPLDMRFTFVGHNEKARIVFSGPLCRTEYFESVVWGQVRRFVQQVGLAG